MARPLVVSSITAALLAAACGSDDPAGSVGDWNPYGGEASSGGSGPNGANGGDTSSDPAGGNANTGGTGASNGGSGNPSVGCETKRGIAYAFDQGGASDDMNALRPKVTWFYDWGLRPSDAIKDSFANMGVEFVPMVHHGGFDVSNAIQAIPEGAKYLLGFNEPNFGSQANLTPENAAALWPQVEQIAAARDLEIVSPALNYCGGDCNETDPFVWLDKFFAACQGCRVDYIAAHWYNCDIPSLESYLNGMRKYQKPIWLTEFACWFGPDAPYSEADAIKYAHDAAVYLDQQPDIFRYAWFTGRTGEVPNASLLGGSGALTRVGNSYVEAESPACP